MKTVTFALMVVSTAGFALAAAEPRLSPARIALRDQLTERGRVVSAPPPAPAAPIFSPTMRPPSASDEAVVSLEPYFVNAARELSPGARAGIARSLAAGEARRFSIRDGGTIAEFRNVALRFQYTGAGFELLRLSW